RVAATATAASTALPPCRSTSSPTRVAVGSTVATAPPEPTAVGPVAACAGMAGVTTRAQSVTAASDNRRTVDLPRSTLFSAYPALGGDTSRNVRLYAEGATPIEVCRC